MFLLLDRDGTINVDLGGGDRYVATPDDLKLIPGVALAIGRAHREGIPIALITNQAGIAKGIIPAGAIEKIHASLEAMISEEGNCGQFRFADIRVCPHHPKEDCTCRKPQPKMILDSLHILKASPQDCYYIGDHLRDLQAADRAGVNPILVRTGHGANTERELLTSSELCELKLKTLIFDDLAQAIDSLLMKRSRR